MSRVGGTGAQEGVKLWKIMSSSNGTTAEPSPHESGGGRTFILSLLMTTVVIVILVILRCFCDCLKQRRQVKKLQKRLMTQQELKLELEVATRIRRERLDRQEATCHTISIPDDNDVDKVRGPSRGENFADGDK